MTILWYTSTLSDMAQPRLVDILPAALRHHGIRLEHLRVYTRPTEREPDLDYCVTWGANRYAAGTIRWWPDVQRLAHDPARLYARHPDWTDLIATIGCVDGGHHTQDAWLLAVTGHRLGSRAAATGNRRQRRESDDALRSRLVNIAGGMDLQRVLDIHEEDPRAGLHEEAVVAPVEPKSTIDRVLDDDLLDSD